MSEASITAIIVAAGRGQRMGGRTANHPKCLLEFEGRTLLEWQLDALDAAGIKDVHLVGGYLHEQLRAFGLPLHVNNEWATTNMVFSLMCAKDVLLSGRTIVVAYADIVYQPSVVEALLAREEAAATVVDENWLQLWQTRFNEPLDDAETLRFACGDRIAELGNKASSTSEIQGQYIGLTQLTHSGAQRFVKAHANIAASLPDKDPRTCYFTDVLQLMAGEADGLFAARVKSGWLEFDTGDDIDAYNALAGQSSLATLWDRTQVESE